MQRFVFLLSQIVLIFFASCKQICPTPSDSEAQYNTYYFQTRIDASAKSGLVASLFPFKNYPDYKDMIVGRWDSCGTDNICVFGKHRYILKIDLSSIPSNAIIDSAIFNLYPIDKTTSENINAASTVCHYGENSLYIEQVLSDWDESIVTWNTKPETSSQNQISVPAIGTGDGTPNNIYITAFAQQWVSNPSQNHGMMIRLQDETTEIYRRVLFAGNGNIRPELLPLVRIYYKTLRKSKLIL